MENWIKPGATIYYDMEFIDDDFNDFIDILSPVALNGGGVECVVDDIRSVWMDGTNFTMYCLSTEEGYPYQTQPFYIVGERARIINPTNQVVKIALDREY